MIHLRVKNFEQYQHYKGRRPVWIKLYNSLLDDFAFARLQDASKAHLVAIWLLASRTGNAIPYDLPFISQTIRATSPVDIDELISAGFLEAYDPASNALATREQIASLEEKREEETRGEKKTTTVALTRRAAKEPKSAPSWVRPVTLAWRNSVGKITEAAIERELAEPIAQHGEEHITGAIQIYAKNKRAGGKAMKLQWFAEDVVTWVLRAVEANQPLVDEFGQLTAYGERVTRPDKVPA